MRISDLICILNDVAAVNGDMDVALCTDGKIYEDLDFNCPDEDSPLYIEGYKN